MEVFKKITVLGEEYTIFCTEIFRHSFRVKIVGKGYNEKYKVSLCDLKEFVDKIPNEVSSHLLYEKTVKDTLKELGFEPNS